MALAGASYVREEGGVLYVGATQAPLYSLIAAWRNEGYSAEELQFGFPTLSLAQVYGAIAYYLDHRQALDMRFDAEDEEYYLQRERDREAYPKFYRRLDERRADLRRRLETAEIHHLPGFDVPGRADGVEADEADGED